MTRTEYEKIQAELSELLDKAGRKGISGKRKEGYELAIRACKSVISNYKPN